MRKSGYRYNYGSYRGRSRSRTILTIVIVVLALVLALVLGIFFLLENHLVFSADGPRLDFPFLSETEDLPPSASEPLVIVSAPPTPAASPSPLPVRSTQAVLLPRGALSDGTAEAKLAEARANTAVFDMKADDGTLGYVSGLELAKQVGASASDPALNATIETLNDGEVYTVARVSCFRDNKTPYTVPRLGIKTRSGYNWRDDGDIRWMSPSKEEARQYVVNICVELAKMGFDEILLDNSGYPTTGHLNYIQTGADYDASQFQSTVTQFYGQVREALSAYPEIKLSVRTDGAVFTDAVSSLSGQSVAGLVASADRIWADLGDVPQEEAIQTLSAAGVAVPVDMLVPVGQQANADARHWAVLG